MIKIIADYHTHTIYSHGKGTIMDNAIAARDKGLKEIAISDHGFRHFAFGVKKRDLEKIRKEIDGINERLTDIKVLLGMECNIISRDGMIDMDASLLKYLDILALGFHMLVKPLSIADYYYIYGKHYMTKLNKKAAHDTIQSNTDMMIKAINNYKIDFITHPGARIPVDIVRLAGEAAKRGTALEINAKNNVMSVEEIKEAAKQGAKFIISSDAHTPQDVGNFENALRLVEAANLTKEQIINAVE